MSRLLPPVLSPLPAFSLPPPLLPRIHIRTSAVRGGAAENAMASGTTARERRLVKVREERRRREYDREHTYPGWAKVLENACRDDEELRAILGDSIGNPELMKQRLANSMMDYDPSYDSEEASTVMPSSFHDISDVEFQDNWARVWVDLGTSDYLGLDVLLNCLTQLSSEHLGIKQVVFGGKKMGDWEEGMTSSDYGYKHFKI
ncbi:plant/F8L15-130 protein [Zea mays]|uniref:Plant/F8L15-130 protein n=1 Tax=Zea mays TaxID=4577 RepID=A0A1D6QAA4_MAIZE|nr:plant/F8L15-130 protein [Zea mays]